MRMRVVSVTNGRSISVKEAMGRAFRRTGQRIKRGFSYYKPSVFKRLKTSKKVSVVLLRPLAAVLIVLFVCAASYGIRWVESHRFHDYRR